MIEFEDIWKSFGGVPVLRAVSFTVPPGRTVGLVGENGAGKSTLMNILGGNLRPDRGRMLLDGRPYAPRHPGDASRAGIAFIHQELNLFPNLSIADNLFLTAFPRRAGVLIDRAAAHRQARALLAEVGLEHAPDTPVERLSAGEQQLVEIARALQGDARLIILDEPTTSLSARETERLFALLARLQQRRIAMIYISHTLSDVRRLCDRVVVLRDGAVVGQGPAAALDTDRLVTLMVGRSLTGLYPPRAGRPTEQVLLEARGVSQPGVVRDISFRLHAGEVLGLAGLMGAGRTELARILFGLDRCAAGEVRLNGQPLGRVRIPQRIERGLAFLTEDRRQDGLCLEASIWDNIALVALRRYARPPLRWLDRERLHQAIREMFRSVRIAGAAREEAPVRTLSGGNQQKVVLAKWLLARPRVLLLDEPTRGIDVGARFEIYQLILELADRGAGVLMISSDLEELLGLCDRILVLHRGEVRDELPRAAFDRERILRAALNQPTDLPAAGARGEGTA